MKSLACALMLVVAAVTVPVLSSTVAAQGAFDRDSCLRNCAWLRPTGPSSGGWMSYQNCMAECERRFWKDFDDRTSDLERERDKD